MLKPARPRACALQQWQGSKMSSPLITTEDSCLLQLERACFQQGQPKINEEIKKKVSRDIQEMILMCHQDHKGTLWDSPTEPALLSSG